MSPTVKPTARLSVLMRSLLMSFTFLAAHTGHASDREASRPGILNRPAPARS